jgi:predicted ATP-grasp superfamily ATP-dependent carboligase
MSVPRPPALLSDATFYGTLAAVRALGRAGTPVRVADARRIGPALWSKYTVSRHRCPPPTSPAFLEWLTRFGEGYGRHVLYPTSDEVVYWIAAHRDELSKHFALYQPDFDTTIRILDKPRLLEAAADAGVDTPQTWVVESADDVLRVMREAEAPLMIKPRTQLFLRHHRKGARLPADRAAAVRQYDRWRRDNIHEEPVASRSREMTLPMLQVFYPEAARLIYSLSGFRDATGKHRTLLGTTKVLQQPRTLGVGLCFEASPVDPVLAERVGKMLDNLNYCGVFEMEFVRAGDRLLLIDMNPRFFNQMALDIARGSDLPRLAYAAALGRGDELADLAARAPPAAAPDAFCNRIALSMQVGAQQLFGTMTDSEAAHWRAWARDRDVVDSVATDDDLRPSIADAVCRLYGCLRHPRAFIRMVALDR